MLSLKKRRPQKGEIAPSDRGGDQKLGGLTLTRRKGKGERKGYVSEKKRKRKGEKCAKIKKKEEVNYTKKKKNR